MLSFLSLTIPGSSSLRDSSAGLGIFILFILAGVFENSYVLDIAFYLPSQTCSSALAEEKFGSKLLAASSWLLLTYSVKSLISILSSRKKRLMVSYPVKNKEQTG